MKASSSIIISPYKDIQHVLRDFSVTHAVSILGPSDGLDWPQMGNLRHLRLKFDDVGYSSGDLIAPNEQLIRKLTSFAKSWSCNGDLLVHCRAGTSRSPAAAMICIAAVGNADLERKISEIRNAKLYFQPNSRMLRLADHLIRPCPNLVEMSNARTHGNRCDEVGAVSINVANRALGNDYSPK